MLHAYQRLEAHGVIRSGRFIASNSVEQFVLPGAIAPLREIRPMPRGGRDVCRRGAYRLNLAAQFIVGERVPALAGIRVLYRRESAPIAA